ncbi:MAG: non-ribosomal peptide synthetase [Chthoniobacterales bacterium]|nr:MAG: non-ribosomal peptide synthetase [Chthoniobacterales bacterium]
MQSDVRATDRRALLKEYLRKGLVRCDAKAAAIPRRKGSGPAPLSYGQEQVWLHSQLAGKTLIYNEAATIHRHGALDIVALERSFAEIVRRHEMWRTTFEWEGDRLVQIVRPPPASIRIPCDDLRALPRVEAEREAIRLATEDRHQPFDLAQGPMYRPRLVRLCDDEHRLFLTLHHIIFDGVSLYRVFLPELQTLYEAFSRNESAALRELPIQYADYAEWQRGTVERALPKEIPYWKALLEDVPVLDLMKGHPRPAVQTYTGEMEKLQISTEVTAALKALSQEQGVTLFMTIVAAFKVLLHGYTGEEDIVVGSATCGRSHTELEGLLGFFLNTVVIRSRFSREMPFTDLLAKVKGATLESLAHGAVPFELLVNRIVRVRDASRPPLFQVLISVEPPLPPLKEGWGFSQMDVEPGTAKFDLYLELDDRPDGLIGRFTYNTALFDRQTIQLLKARWLKLLDRIAVSATERVCDLTAEVFELSKGPSAEERHRLLVEWNETRTLFPEEPVHVLIAAQARLTPGAVALVDGNRQFTYAELNTAADRLAGHLQSLGAATGEIIGVCVERSLEMVVAVLAILKTGAAYVPLDPAFPADRLALMVEDTAMPLLITQKRMLSSLPAYGGKVVCVDDLALNAAPARWRPVQSSLDDRAYVIFTSGSTGRPKGVEITHRNLTNFLCSMQRTPGLRRDDVLLAVTTLSFDIAGLELFLPLVTGARVVLASRETAQDGQALADEIECHGITIMQATPVTWRLLLDAPWHGNHRLKALIGGEPCPLDLAERLLAKCGELWNLYGPTETTIWSTVEKLSPGAARVTIGRPIANTEVYIVDDRLDPVPIGEEGELLLGGAGVARGYLNRPELTAEKFIPHPFKPGTGARLYRTGDLARYLSDGRIECLGRIDRQVKLRGFRLEPGEIESILREHPAIREAVVILRDSGVAEARLLAYVVPAANLPADQELRALLRRKLPDYMVPVAFVPLTRVPLTANGKVDHRALPDPDPSRLARQSGFVAPRNDLERKIAEAWSQVLKLERVGIHDNFFEIGGHSLAAMQALARLRHSWPTELNLRHFFEHPTIAGLVATIPSAEIPARNGEGALVAAEAREEGVL